MRTGAVITSQQLDVEFQQACTLVYYKMLATVLLFNGKYPRNKCARYFAADSGWLINHQQYAFIVIFVGFILILCATVLR